MSEIIASTYEIISEIGSGGGGVAYLANHLRLEKKVVLKANKGKASVQSDFSRREVDILKELSHTYIPQVYDYFSEEGIVYTVIDYIEGESLDKPLNRGEKFSQEQVIKWAKQILEALEYLHSPVHGKPPRGYVHSDIKPANIMKKADGDICLIDFNIALALGEENAIGRSAGYASPEHYGLDLSTGDRLSKNTEKEASGTEILPLARIRSSSNRRRTLSRSSSSASAVDKKVIPDVRSDIYSLGATLYHLLSGKRPVKDAKAVRPLSKKEFSPQIVDIISKAMNPNPDLRYQSAKEMLDAFEHLHQNDIRVVRWRRRNTAAYTLLLLLLAIGTFSSFVGLKRMQALERWMRLTEDADNLFQAGNYIEPLQNVIQVYSEQRGLLPPEPPAHTQEVLTKVLGVYDLADDFEVFKTVELASVPLSLSISENGGTAACICSGVLYIIDLDNGAVIDELPADKSALSEAEYLDSHTIVYAGENGITAYDIEKKKMIWQGQNATGITVSEDGSLVAAVYKDEQQAFVYDTASGTEKYKIDFGGVAQSVAVNDIFLNPTDNLFCLNYDGTLLAASFADGSLKVYDLKQYPEVNCISIFGSTANYSHYEGGFSQQYLAVSASNNNKEESVFSIFDMDNIVQAGGFSSEGYYFTSADNNGIVVGIDNILVEINPLTGEQQPLADTSERIGQYSYDGNFAMTSTGGHVCFFDEQANEMCSFERNVNCNLLKIQGDTAVIGSSDSPEVWIVKYKDHYEKEAAEYDPLYLHDEARLCSDREKIVLFSYDKFRICKLDGTVIKDIAIPLADEVYDQQFIRDGTNSYLDITYNDGSVDRYDASDGRLVNSEKIEAPDLSLYEEFETEHFRIESALHEAPKVYNRETGKQIAELSADGYLTYVYEEGEYLIAQYMETDGKFYGYLMNKKCEILAYLPNLCDVSEDELLFDFPTGHIRKEKIYELDELQEMARQELKEEEENENR